MQSSQCGSSKNRVTPPATSPFLAVRRLTFHTSKPSARATTTCPLMRGSGSTWAAIAGATLPELMHRLGHKTPTAAMRYQHASSERHREVADRLGALLRPGAVELEPVAEVIDITGPNVGR